MKRTTSCHQCKWQITKHKHHIICCMFQQWHAMVMLHKCDIRMRHDPLPWFATHYFNAVLWILNVVNWMITCLFIIMSSRDGQRGDMGFKHDFMPHIDIPKPNAVAVNMIVWESMPNLFSGKSSASPWSNAIVTMQNQNVFDNFLTCTIHKKIQAINTTTHAAHTHTHTHTHTSANTIYHTKRCFPQVIAHNVGYTSVTTNNFGCRVVRSHVDQRRTKTKIGRMVIGKKNSNGNIHTKHIFL